jgi:hypothetical protein
MNPFLNQTYRVLTGNIFLGNINIIPQAYQVVYFLQSFLLGTYMHLSSMRAICSAHLSLNFVILVISNE